VIRLHIQQSNNFHKEQQQNAKWSGLWRCVCSFTAFPVGGPNKGVHYTPSGFRGQCPLRGLWLLTCHITNITLVSHEAMASWENFSCVFCFISLLIVSKLGGVCLFWGVVPFFASRSAVSLPCIPT